MAEKEKKKPLEWASFNLQQVELATADVVCNELRPALKVQTKGDIIFKVRALTLAETQSCRSVRDSTLMEALEEFQHATIEENKTSLKEAFSKLTGAANEGNKDFRFIVSMLEVGLVAPKMDMQDILELSKKFNVVALRLWQEITRLTGIGSEAVKKKSDTSSGKTTNSTVSSALPENSEKPLQR